MVEDSFGDVGVAVMNDYVDGKIQRHWQQQRTRRLLNISKIGTRVVASEFLFCYIRCVRSRVG
jgi:hypothetical protein